MMLMPANHSGKVIHELAKKHPGRLGWLIGPTAFPKTKLREWMPYALDNDAFSAFSKNRPWNVEAWRDMMAAVSQERQTPRWVLVPDVVADKAATLEKWRVFAPEAAMHGWPIAFAVQDGMESADVPSDANVVFVGGTTAWKWRTAKRWASEFPRVHVGRVNTSSKLWFCQDAGCESVDGTGWFRDPSDPRKVPVIVDWLNGERPVVTTEFNFATR
jgi:hypothetical protein